MVRRRQEPWSTFRVYSLVPKSHGTASGQLSHVRGQVVRWLLQIHQNLAVLKPRTSGICLLGRRERVSEVALNTGTKETRLALCAETLAPPPPRPAICSSSASKNIVREQKGRSTSGELSPKHPRDKKILNPEFSFSSLVSKGKGVFVSAPASPAVISPSENHQVVQSLHLFSFGPKGKHILS